MASSGERESLFRMDDVSYLALTDVHLQQVSLTTPDFDSFFLFKPNETLIDDIQPYLTLEDKNENTFAAELARLGHDRDRWKLYLTWPRQKTRAFVHNSQRS
ncbi:hypothetical protein Hypma_014348 [Hypsizygus marmoreus]|uniref:Uncharacterized protein n=1 Tax=Hypsizygus marmoreus TaxID=39966 RepID=A0A369JCH2_HYPMA|nr:hypothetical protein Hypma_014348 [Hypsizygus marmoreus]